MAERMTAERHAELKHLWAHVASNPIDHSLIGELAHGALDLLAEVEALTAENAKMRRAQAAYLAMVSIAIGQPKEEKEE